jgi:hypothetical protein
VRQPLGDPGVAVVDTAEPGSGAGRERTSSAEEARKRALQVRALPVEQLVADIVFSLLNAAQIKLGRRDARLLIDLGTVVHEHARPYLSCELATQIDQLLGQLRLGQVSAEGHPSPPGEPEHNDLDRVPTPPHPSAPQSPAK